MQSRFKSNNFIALLIAILLIAIGFALGFIHKQSEARAGEKQDGKLAVILHPDNNEALDLRKIDLRA